MMSSSKTDRNAWRTRGRVAVLVLFAGLAWGAWQVRERRQAAAREAVGLTVPVHRGPLTINLTETGTLRNRERLIVRSEVNGFRTILQLVDEGTLVKAGDLLVELDASELEEQQVELEARLQNSEAAVVQSRENLEVARNQATADVAQAEIDLKFARMALHQYVEGEYPQQLQQAEAAITIAGEELQRARDGLEWSRRLETDGYITRSELDADELALKRRELDMELAIGKRDLLTEHTHVQTLERLNSNILQAEMALERVQRRARADLIRAESDLRSKEFDLSHQRSRLERLVDQIAKCRILSPNDGMVIHATSVQTHRWRRIDPLEPGQTVRERQELIHLPTTTEMMVEISMQEAHLPKLSVGLPARITMDTGPDRIYSGHLRRIGILPDSGSMALNPDLKLYVCEVLIDATATGLRPGMSCQVELLIEEHPDALHVPLQALTRVGGVPTLYVVGPGGPAPRPVEIGLDNGRMVHLLAGVAEGERVLLAPPLAPAERRRRDVPRPEIEPPPAPGNGTVPNANEPPREPRPDAAPERTPAPAPGRRGPPGGRRPAAAAPE